MINFRYHVVSIIGIFIALAVGVVLGAGPLQSVSKPASARRLLPRQRIRS